MPTRELRRTPASFPINIPEDASSDSSASPRDLSPLFSSTAPIVTVPASPTTDLDVSDESPYSRAGYFYRDTGDIEQPGQLGHAEAPYSQAGSLDRDTQDTEQPGPIGHAEALYSRAGSLYRDTRDIEQPGLLGHAEVLELVLSTETPDIWSN